MKKALQLALLLALLPVTGCAVKVPGTTAATYAAYSYSWIEQVKVQVEPTPAGPRVASAPQSWHLIRLSVGRLDGSMPVLTKTINPFDSNQSRRVLSNLTPGDGYFIQASLIHQDGAGTEWEVARGQLGGDGSSVHLNAGPNAVPIVMKPMVAGGIVSAHPTPLARRNSRRSGASSVVVIDSGSSDDWEPDTDDAYEELPDAETIYDWIDEAPAEDDWESTDESEDESESYDDDSDEIEDTGDWFGVSSAFRVSR